MKKIFLSLLTTLLLCSCGNKVSHNICKFIEEATEKTEKATTLKEVENINHKLIQNIGMYCMSLNEKEYEEWEKDPASQKAKDEAELNYKTAKAKKEKELKGK